MKKSVLMTLVVLCAITDASGRCCDETGWSSARHYSAQTGGALLGGALIGAGATAIFGLAGAAIARSASHGDPWAGLVGLRYGALAGMTLGYPFGCGLGVSLVGGVRGHDGGSLGAYAGAYAGVALGAVALAIRSRYPPHPDLFIYDIPLLAMAVASPAGAVIGYSLQNREDRGWTGFGTRVCPPVAACGIRPGIDHSSSPVFDLRLVTVRF